MILYLQDVVLQSIKGSLTLIKLLIKNMQCDRTRHGARFMALVVNILAMSIVFPSLALSQTSNSLMREPQSKNLQSENTQKLNEWPQTVMSQQGIYRLTLSPAPGKIPMRRLHSWYLHIEDTLGTPVSGARIHIDGGMPAHGHGLPTVPKANVLPGEGDYIVEGMKFTMGGEWQLRLAIVHHRADRVSIMFTLNP